MKFSKNNYSEIEIETFWTISRHCYGEVIQNRKKFIIDYDINFKFKKVPHYIYNEFKKIKYDHNEVYYTKDKSYILLSSPYHDYEESFIQNGWSKYDDMYSDSATTWIKIIPGKSKINCLSL